VERSVAFLRAINVGGHTVKMADLRRLFERLGFEGVETFIASGNVIFDAVDAPRADVEARIAAGLEESLGYAVPTFVRTPAELARVAAFDGFEPLPEGTAFTMYAGFLAEPVTEDAVAAFTSDLDAFRVGEREVFWRCLKRQDSKFSAGIFERRVGAPVTFRNLRTVQRLAKKYPAL